MSRTARVGFLIDRWQPLRGGAEAALAQLATHLEQRGCEVLAFGSHGPRPDERAPGEFHRVGARGWPRGRRERALGEALVTAARAHGCDLTVGVRHLPEVDLLWCHGGAHAVTLAARRRATGGEHVSDSRPRVMGRHRTFLALERQLVEEGRARRVVCPSKLVLDELTRLYPSAAGRLVVVPNGVDLERFHPRERAGARRRLVASLGLDPALPLLVFAARNPILKGFEPLVAALSLLGQSPWHLLVAGPRHPRRLRRTARAAGIARERVTCVEHVDALDLAAGADVAVQPTWRDPCALVTLEALAAGTPVVTTRLNGASEVFGDSSAGTVIEHPGRIDALAGAVRERLETPSDPERVRAHVLDRGRAKWLANLEARLLALLSEG